MSTLLQTVNVYDGVLPAEVCRVCDIAFVAFVASGDHCHRLSPALSWHLLCCFALHAAQDWRVLQTYADTVDEEFRLEYGLSASTQRYTAKWALSEVLGLMHRYLQVGATPLTLERPPPVLFCFVCCQGYVS